MGRPDLPLILLVLGVAGAIALFTEPAPVRTDAGQPGGAAAASDPVEAFFADLDPVLLRCIGAPLKASDGESPSSPPAIVKQVSAQVEELRGLRFTDPVDASFLSKAEMERRISKLLAAELPRAQVTKEGEILELLGALPPQGDLYAITEEALGSQVAGLYDTKTRDLLVRSAAEPGALELTTLAHELEHALADQRLGLRESVGTEEAADRKLAYLAVVEGDATLTMLRYALAHVGLADQLSLGETVPGERAFDALPDYVQRSFLFPYLEGLRLVCHRWVAGGWRAVDRLYARPPASTDEVIFPERYGDGPPVDPRDPPSPGPDWRPRLRRELGAAELEWLLSAPGGDPAAALPEPRALVSAWAGGEVVLWKRGEDRALALALAQRPGASTLCGALTAWYERARPESRALPAGAGPGNAVAFAEPGRFASITCRAREVRVGLAPSPEVAATLAG